MARFVTVKVLISVCFSLALSAQTPFATAIEPSDVVQEIPANRGSSALWQSLKKLHTRASMLMITAHPDDEDGGTLTYESRGEGARVSLLTLNRGEGGANVMSADYFDALGLVRTTELLEADRRYGVEQYWTRVVDYGFSKTMAESLGKWTHDRVFYDVVRVVRLTRPLVITSVFVGGPTDGHGNHQTAGALAQEVYQAAGDPTAFPDQIQAGLKPWTPLKVYARVASDRAKGEHLSANVEIPVGQYDALLGESYLQLAREGLGFQKSQNGGPSFAFAGPASSRYHRYVSRVVTEEKEDSFFSGIDTSLLAIASLAGQGSDQTFLLEGLAHINQSVEQALNLFSAVAPEKTAPALATGLEQTVLLLRKVEQSTLSPDAKFSVTHELEIKRTQFNNALVEALGVTLAATASPETATAVTPGEVFAVELRMQKQTAEPVSIESLRVNSSEAPPEAKRFSFTVGIPVEVPADANPTKAYFSRRNIEQPYYDIQNNRSLNRPLTPYPFTAWADLKYRGVPIRIGQYVQSVKHVTGEGTVFIPLVIVPALSISLSHHASVTPLSAKRFSTKVDVQSNAKGTATGKVKLTLPAGWTSDPPFADFKLTSQGSRQSFAFQINPHQMDTQSYSISAVAEYGGQSLSDGYQSTGYPGLRPSFLYRPATSQITGVDLKMAQGLNIGYIMGSGDDVPAALEQLGIHVVLLTPADVAAGDLDHFDLILLGIRAYAAREELPTHNNRLLEYVSRGGVVVVQYNTPEFDHNFGPYPYVLSNDPEEVTDEASAVRILDPTNPIFRWPNLITEKDFEGWVEERGSKWMKSWDPHYAPLLETHDANQPEQRGGLLYAKYGKGIYIYNAYAFYRQLPEGVPGAYRLFANLISLPRNPHR